MLFRSVLGSAAFAGGSKEKVGGSDYPAAMDAWAKEAKLGKYDKNQDWDEIIAKAKQEGEVVVYSASSRMAAVGEAFTKKYPEIPWSEIAKMRDILTHHYFGVDDKVLWDTLGDDFNDFEKVINDMLDTLDKQNN